MSAIRPNVQHVCCVLSARFLRQYFPISWQPINQPFFATFITVHVIIWEFIFRVEKDAHQFLNHINLVLVAHVISDSLW